MLLRSRLAVFLALFSAPKLLDPPGPFLKPGPPLERPGRPPDTPGPPELLGPAWTPPPSLQAPSTPRQPWTPWTALPPLKRRAPRGSTLSRLFAAACWASSSKQGTFV